MRVLVADDNVDLADGIASVLRGRGASVAVCYTGTEAERLLAAERWDLLLLDLKLPGRSGLDVLRSMKALPSRPRTVVMTGYDAPDRVARALVEGAERVLRKPFPMQTLLGSLGLGAHSGPDAVDRARVVMLGGSQEERQVLQRLLSVESFDERDLLREAVAEHLYDAAVVADQSSAAEELCEDLHHLDPNLSVVRRADPRAVLDGAERTRLRRTQELVGASLSGLVDEAPAALLVAGGPDLSLRRWNRQAAHLLGYRPDELALLEVAELEAEGSALSRTARRAAAGEQPPPQPFVLRLRGGEHKAVRCQFVALPATGEVGLWLTDPVGWIGHQDALQLLGATAAGVAHEVRNTLAGVGSSMAVLEGRFEAESEAARIVRKVVDRVRRATEVMNDLLDFARPLVLRPQPVPGRLLVHSAAEQLREGAPAGIRIVEDVPDATQRVLVDPARLQLALLNLGNNAIQAMGERGELRISCRAVPGGVEFVVSDDGPGVAEAVRGRIFEPFFTTRSQGSGLGLANVRKVVQAHGGEVRVEDARPGARFVVRLPSRPPEEQKP